MAATQPATTGEDEPDPQQEAYSSTRGGITLVGDFRGKKQANPIYSKAAGQRKIKD
jgi:hypothetical protein